MKRYYRNFVKISVLQTYSTHTFTHVVLVDIFECSQQLKEWQDAWDEDKSEVEKQGIGEHCMF